METLGEVGAAFPEFSGPLLPLSLDMQFRSRFLPPLSRSDAEKKTLG